MRYWQAMAVPARRLLFGALGAAVVAAVSAGVAGKSAANRPATSAGLTAVWAPSLPASLPLRERVFRSTRAIDQLAADGARVAMLYSGRGPGPCIELWDVSTGRVDGFPRTTNLCPGESEGRIFEITEIALGGERILWAEREHNHNTYWDVLTATPTRRAPEDVYGFSSGDSSRIRDLHGDGELLVFSMYYPELKPQSRLYRAYPGKATRLRTFPRGVRLVGVHGPAIVVGARKGLLEVLNAGGKLVRTLDVRVAEVSRVALDGSSLVVQRGRSVDVYDLDSGRLVSTWPKAKGLLEDAHGGIAVCVSDTAVHLIRLADGRDVVLSTPTKGFGEGPLRAQIEAAGLFYSYTNYKAARPGHVVFVPYRQLVRRFG